MAEPAAPRLRQQAAMLHGRIRHTVRRLMLRQHLEVLELEAMQAAIALSNDEHEPNRVVRLRLDPESQRLTADLCIEGEPETLDEGKLARLPMEAWLDVLEAAERAHGSHAQPDDQPADTARIRAYQGDRIRNVERIADAIQALTPQARGSQISLSASEARQLWGWAEQLRIIVAELAPPA